MVQWLELLVTTEAALDFVLSVLICLFFIGYCRASRTAARKVAAAAFVVIGAGQALEAALFLWQMPSTWEGASSARSVALLVVRSSVLLSAALVSTLVWRSGGGRGR